MKLEVVKLWIEVHWNTLIHYGGIMKNTSSNEADLGRFRGDTFWGKVNMKLKKLATAIEMYKGGSMSIDDIEYRWVDDRINYLEKDGRKLTKDEMRTANDMWRKYGEDN